MNLKVLCQEHGDTIAGTPFFARNGNGTFTVDLSAMYCVHIAYNPVTNEYEGNCALQTYYLDTND